MGGKNNCTENDIRKDTVIGDGMGLRGNRQDIGIGEVKEQGR